MGLPLNELEDAVDAVDAEYGTALLGEACLVGCRRWILFVQKQSPLPRLIRDVPNSLGVLIRTNDIA